MLLSLLTFLSLTATVLANCSPTIPIPVVGHHPNHPNHRPRLVIDTDGAPDDMQALTIALTTKRAVVMAITTTTGGVSAAKSVINVKRVLVATKRDKDNIPIYKGVDRPLIGGINTTQNSIDFFGHDGNSDQPNAYPQVRPDFASAAQCGITAAEAMVKLLEKNKGQITLVLLGPMTNLALALRLEPKIAEWAKDIVIMGGNAYGMGNLVKSQTTEFNFNLDPEAAFIVLRDMKCPIKIVTLESTFFWQDEHGKKYDFYAHMNQKPQTPLAGYLKTVTQMPRDIVGKSGVQNRFFDEIAAGVAVNPKIVKRSKKMAVTVELHGAHTRGQMVVGWADDSFGDDAKSMREVELILDYDFHRVMYLLKEAVKNVDLQG